MDRPGKPTDNAYIESSNGTLRAECPDTRWFGTMGEARETIEAWRKKRRSRHSYPCGSFCIRRFDQANMAIDRVSAARP
jgi:Integrase core domain